MPTPGGPHRRRSPHPEFGKLIEKGEASFCHAMIELGLLTAMTIALVVCLVALRTRYPATVAERA